MTPARDISSFSETDVREEIVAPLLRRLGYAAGSEANIIREQSLRYPRAMLGRKKPATDPPLRGRADYVCEVSGIVRWTIEAKASTETIGDDAVEQAFTYAVHPEVRAVLFAVTNGLTLDFYQTDHGPDAGPVLRILYENLEQAFTTLEGLVGPAALLANHPRIEPDVGVPLAPGLRSVMRVVNGIIQFRNSTSVSPHMSEMNLSIAEGAVQRREGGGLIAYLVAHTSFRSLDELNRRLGLDRMELESDDEQLSRDPRAPTKFGSVRSVHFAAGEYLFDMATASRVRLPSNMSCRITTRAEGHLADRAVIGVFSTLYEYTGPAQSLSATGDFRVFLG